MTQSPERRTQGVDGPAYDLNIICAAPGCDDSRSLQRHHLWRRSDMGGDKWWVLTTDDRLNGNCVKLCGFHHREITDNIARIVYHDAQFWWKDVLGEPLLLAWQPPQQEPGWHLAGLIAEVEAEKEHTPLDLQLVEKLGADHVLGVTHEPDICPTCLRKLPRPKDESAPEAPKVRKTWSVAVPMDHWEDGANVIDTLLIEARDELARNGLPYGEGRAVKYYILTAALGLFVTHAESLMSDG